MLHCTVLDYSPPRRFSHLVLVKRNGNICCKLYEHSVILLFTLHKSKRFHISISSFSFQINGPEGAQRSPKEPKGAQVIKQIKGQSKISRFLIPTKFGEVRGVQATTKTKTIPTIEARQSKTHKPSTNNSQGNSSELEKPGSQQAHNQSDAQDKHTKHCEQGLYLAETS